MQLSSTAGTLVPPSPSCWVRLLLDIVDYQSLTLDDTADRLQPPKRDINSPLRFPISNVFKGQSSTTGVSGRVCGGLVQVGERLRVLPGDETAVVKGYSSLVPFFLGLLRMNRVSHSYRDGDG
jgi:hypothetical protein